MRSMLVSDLRPAGTLEAAAQTLFFRGRVFL
jgi:hypothetical protein